MGIIKAIAGAVGGALADQWLEVIEKTVPPKTVDINKEAFLTGYSI